MEKKMDIRIELLKENNFNENSLDEFQRHQVVTECWRNVDGEWKLLPIAFVEDWSKEKCHEIATNMANNLHGDIVDFGAFDGEKVVGYVSVSKKLIGSNNQYVQLVEFQVSEPYRGKGIGKMLFQKAIIVAKSAKAEKLYISTHSSKESHAAYCALGCVHAKEIIKSIADEEPCDVQMEYELTIDDKNGAFAGTMQDGPGMAYDKNATNPMKEGFMKVMNKEQ